jgi:hypothetical protein
MRCGLHLALLVAVGPSVGCSAPDTASVPGDRGDGGEIGATVDDRRDARDSEVARACEIWSCDPASRPTTCGDGAEVLAANCVGIEPNCSWKIERCAGGACMTDDDCRRATDGGVFSQFCRRATKGACGGSGSCVPSPTTCPDVVEPVCGCDGASYANECLANRAGTTVAQEGPCWPGKELRACGGVSDQPCTGGSEWCDHAAGCSGAGACRVRPIACGSGAGPVCGCDGKTYPDACSAAAAGKDVARDGAC